MEPDGLVAYLKSGRMPEKKRENLSHLLLVMSLLPFLFVSHAAGIYQMDYRHSFEGIARDSAPADFRGLR